MIRRAAITGLLRLTSLLPFALTHAIGVWVGSLLWWIPNDLRRIASRNLVLTFPGCRLPTASVCCVETCGKPVSCCWNWGRCGYGEESGCWPWSGARWPARRR